RAAALPGAFVARVLGTSMEPRIPDGSCCLFRRPGPGNRAGRILLVEHRASTDPEEGGSYLLKMVERSRAGGRERVVLRSLHPGVEPVVMDRERRDVRVVEECVGVMG